MIMTKFASSFSRSNKNHLILRNLDTKFYLKTRSFLTFLMNQKIRKTTKSIADKITFK